MEDGAGGSSETEDWRLWIAGKSCTIREKTEREKKKDIDHENAFDRNDDLRPGGCREEGDRGAGASGRENRKWKGDVPLRRARAGAREPLAALRRPGDDSDGGV